MTPSTHRLAPLLLLLALTPLVFLYGCDSGESLISANEQQIHLPASTHNGDWDGSSVNLPSSNPAYVVYFDGYHYDGTNTTFSYHIENRTGPSQTHIYLEQPSCAIGPQSATPSNGTSNSDNIGFAATKWTIETPATGEAVEFSVTYSGEVFLGSEVRVAVKGGSTVYNHPSFLLPGACHGDFTVSGNVTLDNSTTPVPGAWIIFDNVNDSAATDSVQTDSDGTYAKALTPGRYQPVVRAPYVAAASLSTFYGGPDVELDISVNLDSDFLVDQIKGQKQGYQSTVTTYTPDQWLTIFKQRRGAKSVYSESQLLDFLVLIEALPPVGSEYPYNFGSDKIKDAISRLSDKDRETLELELLALELNHVADLGLQDKELQQVIIEWAERDLVSLSLNKQSGAYSTAATTSTYLLAYTINRSGTGGTGGQN